MGNGPAKEESKKIVIQSFSELKKPRSYIIPLADSDGRPDINFLTLEDLHVETIEWTPDDVVPIVFRWEHGGRKVFIAGSFNNWEERIPMHRSGNDFTYIHDLTRERHAFKFFVDNEWQCAPDQPTLADENGSITNVIDVTDFIGYTGDENFAYSTKRQNLGSFSQFTPDFDEYTKEPPPLPPQLRQIILNKLPVPEDSAMLLPPSHVSLDHLFCTAVKGCTTVLGMTQRYKHKYVTTVYYRMMPVKF